MAPGPGQGTPDEKQPEHRPSAAATNDPAQATPRTPGGTSHGSPMPRSAIQGKGDSAADLTPESKPDAEWQRAEHISEASMVADDKVAETGSAGLAKQHLDTADDRAIETQSRAAELARRGSSQPVPPNAKPQAGGPPTPAAGIDPRSGKSRSIEASPAPPPTAAATTSATGKPARSSAAGSAAYPAGKATSKDDLARTLGFPSFLEFFEGSQPLSSEQNNVWYTSALPKNEWVLWNSQTLEYSRPLATLELAKQASSITG